MRCGYLVLAMFLFALCSCSEDGSPSDDRKQSIQLSTEQKSIVDGYAEFSYRLFNSASETVSVDENIIVSPWGAANILSMLCNAGDAQARNSISTVLCQTDGADLNSINKYLYGQMAQLTGKVRLDVYRSFWFKSGFNVSADFCDVLADDYYADIKEFSSAGRLASDFKEWVRSKSKGLLDGAGVPLSNETTFLLADMMYFNGKWQFRFDAKASHEGVFHNADGIDANVTMMEIKKPFQWYSCDMFDALWMNFANGEYSMAIMLPCDGYDVDYVAKNVRKLSFEEIYTAENIENKKCGVSMVPVTIPRFDVGAKVNYRDVLMQLGVEGYLNDFDRNVIDVDILQQSRIKIDEDGAVMSSMTTGSGVTDVGFADGEPFIVDRPFVYVVSETSTGVVLQMGKIARL